MRRLLLFLLASAVGFIAKGAVEATSLYAVTSGDTLVKDSSSYLLEEVVIRASPVSRKTDRFVLVVPLSISKDGVELLQQAPGVWLSDDQIAINGSSGTKVFVDNREIRLTKELLMVYLHSLKSEQIARIEVVPMTGADGDANAQGGAIHIYMRHRTDNGMQGNLSVTTALSSSLQYYQPSGNLSLHHGKWEVYTFASSTFTPENKEKIIADRSYFADEKNFKSETWRKQPSRYGVFRVGVIHTIDTLNSVGGEFEYIRRSSVGHSQSASFLTTGPSTGSDAMLESQGIYRQKEVYNMYSAAVNFIHRLDANGSVVKFIADYMSKEQHNNNQYATNQRMGNVTKDTLYRSYSQAVYQIGTVDLNWKQQFSKQTYGQVGVKYTYTSLEDDARYEGMQSDGSWTNNKMYEYGLHYHEQIGAAYATYAHEWKYGAIHAGLRGEYTQTSDRTHHQTRGYWDWFPHLDVTLYGDELRRWMLVGQYARYIERPAFAALSPNRIQTSDYSYVIGNPALRPTYITKFSATLVYNYRYTFTVGGNLHRDLIREFAKEDVLQPDVSYIIYENHYRENHWFVAVSVPWQPTTWLNLNTNLIGVKQDIRLSRNTPYVSHYLYFGNADITFYLPSEYALEGQYRGASRLYSGNSGIEPFHVFSIRLRKKWKEGNYVATVGVDNVLNRKNNYFSQLPAYTATSRYQSGISGRLVKFAFTWNFTQGKKVRTMTVEKQTDHERSRLEGK